MRYGVPIVITAEVYLVRDADRRVLYVGMSGGPADRVASHRRKEWGHLIADFVTIGDFPRALAEQIEHDTILAIQPPFNVASKNGLRAHEAARKRQAELRAERRVA